MIGIVLALITSVFFALYIIPRKFSKLTPIRFNILMATGFSAGSLILYGLQWLVGNNESLFQKDLLFAGLAGILWATAIMLLVSSIDLIGLARSNQWKNIQGPIGVLLALIVLSEAESVNPWLAMLSGLIIFSAAATLNIRKEQDSKKLNMRGVLLALSAGLLFGTVSMISKYVTVHAGVYAQNVWISLSVLASLLIYRTIRRRQSIQTTPIPRRDLLLGLSSGFLYLGASTFMFLSFQKIEASIAFTIIQMNFIGVVGMGILFFKEIDVKGNIGRILSGLILATLGVVVLAFAR